MIEELTLFTQIFSIVSVINFIILILSLSVFSYLQKKGNLKRVFIVSFVAAIAASFVGTVVGLGLSTYLLNHGWRLVRLAYLELAIVFGAPLIVSFLFATYYVRHNK